jgi:hypothetical protein
MTRSLYSAGQAVACARFLPAPLIEARASVFDPLNCQDLNLTARRALFGILTFLNLANKTKAIFPRRDTLRAESLIQSDATLYRGLAVLEAKGYISRAQKRNNRNGKFYLSPIALTDKALALLGLGKVIHKKPSLALRDGHIKKELTKDNQSLKKTTSEQDSSKNTEIDGKTRLPNELVPLLNLDVSKSAICWLMNQCKKHGKRLGDVYRVVESNVKPLRGKAVVAYLMALIKKDIDFKWIARDKSDRAVEVEMAHAVKTEAKQLDDRYDGCEVVRQDGTLIGIFRAAETPGGIAFVHGADGSLPVNQTFVRAWLDGLIRLRPKSDLLYDGGFSDEAF